MTFRQLESRQQHTKHILLLSLLRAAYTMSTLPSYEQILASFTGGAHLANQAQFLKAVNTSVASYIANATPSPEAVSLEAATTAASQEFAKVNAEADAKLTRLDVRLKLTDWSHERDIDCLDWNRLCLYRSRKTSRSPRKASKC